MDGRKRPRVLVSGFSVFPGAPINPTEALVGAIEAGKARFSDLCNIYTAVLDVDYRGLPARLGEIGASVQPDIAIHFGLSGSARGFALERTARNIVCCKKPDNTGHVPADARICAGEDALPSSLPIEELHKALKAAELPVEFSDNAGDYLCNYLFYLSRGNLCAGFTPAMAGFIHVPLVGAEGCAMTFDALSAGARIIVETCCLAGRDEFSA